MGKSESFYFPEDESRPARHVSQSGCFVKLTTGFILLLLAILIAVGVGLIVHFAEKKNDSCDLHSNNQGSSNAQTGSGSGGDVIITVPTTTSSTTTTTKKVSTAKTTVKPTAATTLTTTAATAGPTTPSQPQFHRLATDVIPLQYDLNIEPHMYSGDPSSFTFDGTVKIRLQCKKASKIIYLNYKEMTIQENSIKISSVDPAEKTTIQHLKLSPEEQLITIETANPLTVSKEYIVEISYSGPLQKDLKGFYLSSYQDEGFTRYLATTQFQPTDARKAFPCMDEPNFKAVFQVSIVRPKGWTSLANAALETTNDLGNGRYEDVFEPTLKMSTYLVAFVISQFDHKNDTTKDGILYRVWSRPNAIEETNEALGLGTDILTFYENLFKVKFPLKKQDMIAIPDYPLGAMENWGLVTYRETAMLYDPKLSPASQRQVVTTDIAHELSHMWFGDLVTMSWWDDLWLNEGFATFIQYIGVDHAHPDWNMIEQFITKTVHVAMAFDSYKSSHPIYVPVNSPDEIGEIFDKISYSKGGSVIKMAENFLGRDTFFKGLSEYLKNLAYGSSTHDDLFRYLNEQATKDGVHLPNSLTVADIMNTWILQMNYPVVTFTRQQDKVAVSQKRFLVNGDAIANEKYASPYNYSWIVPVTMTWKDNPVTPKVAWLLNENKELEGSVPKDSPWILGNVDEVGYYRVNYDLENWNALIQQLSEDRTKISQRNRAQIVNDAWNLAKAGMLDLDIALRSVEYLSTETNYVPWAAAITELNYLDLMLSSSELYGKLEEFMRKITTNEYKRLGMESADSSHIDRLTRSVIVSVACGYGLEECVTDAQQLFKRMMETGDQSVIPVDVKRTVYCTAISHGGWEEWEYTLNQMMTSTVAAEVSLLQGALSCSSQTWILSYYLQLSLNDSVIRSQDTIRVIEDVSQNPVGRLMAWQFVQDEWDYLRNKYGGAWFNFGDLIKTVTNTFNTQAHVEELQNFIRDHPNLGTAQRAFEQAIEQVQNNMMFMQVNEEIIRKWLQKTSVGTEAEAIDVRLPRDVIPSLYELEIQPDIYQDNPDNFSFSGHVKIHVECVAATSVIKFHTVDLSIDQSSVRVIHANAVPSSGEVPVASISYDAKRQFTILNLGQPLEASQGYTLEMSYKGPLRSDKMAGLYTSSYMRNGQPVYLATTQMEPTDARRAFPCFDEPAMKAKFKLTIVRKSSKLSVSNMPKLSQETRKDGWIADVFDTSQTMSTYLVAFVVCDFVNRTGITTNNITYGAWSRPEVHDQTELALDVGVDTLTFYEDFFGVKFPLPKQDMIAVPDFSAGAMENWGLITYRENSMLYKEGVSSTADKQWTTETITHELAHQWFGDLVTMSWWDDLWLNEGFATFVQYLGTDNKFPSWNMFEQFTVKVLQPAFDFDSLTSSHPIYVPVKNPDEINEIFDSISYDKGASIIRMMRHFIGEETFKQGLKNYLEDRKFSNAFHDDLWYALGNQTVADGHTIDVKQIMDTWTLQMNYPVVMVKRVSSSTLSVQQKRYLRDYSAPESTKYTSPFNYQWIVPLTFTTAGSPDFDQDYSKVQMLRSSEMNVHIANDAKDWILCNVKQNGFYRVNYDESNWNLLLQQLKTDHEVIHPINRAQIINDAWALIKSGDLDIMFGLKSFEYLGKEMSYVPWFAANGELSYVKRMFSRSPVYGDLQSFLRNIVKEPFNALEKGGKSLGHIEKLARAKVTSIACANHLPECETMAMEEFQKWQSDPDTYRIDPDLKEFLMCSAISQGGVAEWDFLFERFQKSDVANERRMIMSALACTGEPWVLQRYLGYALDDTKIKSQDASYPLRYASTNSIGREIVWNFIKDNWMVLLNRYGGGSFTMSNILTSATSSFNTPSELQMMKEFKGQHPNMGSGTRAFEQAIEKTQSNIQWMTDNYNTIESWLQTVVTPDKGNNQVLTDVRLPRSVLPDLYHLELFPDIYGPDPENFTFSGHVTITVNCTGTTDKIIMHSNKLTIDRGSVSVQEVGAQGSGNVQVTRLSHDLDRQFVILQLGSNLTQGKQYKVYMEFMSPLKNDLAGVYLSSYMRQNKTVYLATTQMEPTDARKTFPCFDEPDMKAKFQLNIVRKNSRISVSNMPLVRQETRGNELIADVFATSQTMSTYLVAFVVCDFVNRTGITTNNITYGAWSRPEVHDQTELALDVGVDTLTFYEDFFGVKFPLPKQDMIAVPDFSAGAMENWGLITYRENSMLYKEGVSSTADKQWTTETITHELAHQWFGDLVTMSWWDDLWLNEGFATFVQYLGTDNKFPSWNMFEQFTVKVLQPAFDFDSLTSSHPIYVPVKNPDEINEIFDSISYDKGASIIRMMRHFIGEETFKQGLKNYLEDRKFSNAFHDDLWYALGNQTVADGHTIDVKQIMDTWTLQMNYPVVMVKRVSSSTVRVQQKRYLRDYSAPESTKYTSPFNYQWIVPLTFTTAASPDFDQDYSKVQMLRSSEMSVYVANDAKDWILCNVKQNGFYRVNYDESNWNLLLQQLKTDHKVIDPINRAQLINDAWALVKSGDLAIKFGLKSLEYLGKEMSYVPWFAANGELSYVKRMLSRSPVYGDLQTFLRSIVKEPFNALQKEGTSSGHIDKLARSKITSIACANHLPECETMAMEEFQKWQSDPDTYRIDPDVKEFLMCSAISQGGVAEWDFLFERFQKSDVANERRMIMSALACTGEPWVLQRYLGYALDDTKIKSQDASYPLRYASTNSIGREIVWNFIKDNWMVLLNRYGGGSFTMSNILTSATSSFNTPSELQMMKEFKGQHPNMGSGTRAFEQAIEKTQSNIQWMTDNYNTIESWLQTVVTPDKGNNQVLTDVRLPRSVLPDLYQLELFPDIYGPDPENFTFSGHVTITVNCTGTTDKIIMHSNKLTIDRDSVSVQEVGAQGSGIVQVTSLSYDLDRQFVILQLGFKLTQGKQYTVYMKFIGPLKDDLTGLYLSSYKRGNHTVYLATTQMEATEARKAFPCFDEPDMKAMFEVTIIRSPSKKSVSNMPLLKTTTRPNGMVADEFDRSVRMSSYLVAFIVHDFDRREDMTKNGVKYGVLARRESMNQTALALHVGVKTLEYYEEFFGIRFPLPKQDMIAIPDFDAGAMENWGLITYRETAMLFKEGVSSAGNKERVTTVVTHELAHQWFGDLVTMGWWDDLWLNEGFASYVEYLGADHVFPELEIFKRFTYNEIQRAMAKDGLVTSHPIYARVYNPDQINEIFDSISYSKGATIIRMMRFFVGDAAFKKGLNRYLTSRMYGNSFHDDLWFAMGNETEAEGQTINVKDIMDTWTLQMGFPVLNVSRLPDGSIRVSQKRFLQNYQAVDPMKYVSPFNYIWKVPLTFTSEPEKKFQQNYRDITWLDGTEQVLDNQRAKATRSSKWILFNTLQMGYYRVNYDRDNWLQLIYQLNTNHTAIPAINRGQIINDAWAISRSGELDIEIPLRTSEYLANEMDYVPWVTSISELAYVRSMLSKTEHFGKFRTFMANLVKAPFKKFGFNIEKASHMESYLISDIVSLACYYGIGDCVTQAEKLFQQWMDNPDDNPVHPDLKSTIYCTAVREGGDKEWDFLYQQYNLVDVAAEQRRILSALGCTRKPWILNTYLQMSLQKDKVKKQDSSYVISYVGSNPIGGDLAWKFFTTRWPEIRDTFAGSFFSMRTIVEGVTSGMNTQTDLEQLEDFKRIHSDLGAGTTVFNEAIERTKSNIQWMQTNYLTVASWLDRTLNAQTGTGSQGVKFHRLPRHILPRAYELEILPDIYKSDPSNFRFFGQVTIHLNCVEAGDNITLNSNISHIDGVQVTHGGQVIQVKDVKRDDDQQLLVVMLSSSLVAGENYTLKINYTGPLTNDLNGLYYSSYTENGTIMYMASTHFEPVRARKMLPCFDEPDLKATFAVTIVRRDPFIALSNMPLLKSEKRSSGLISDTFKTSPIMSTYLLAIAVCQFAYREQNTSHGIQYRAWAVPYAVDQTKLALEVGVKTITFYEDFFNISFPLPKQDMIAIPNFAPGAMENWGLITYRETAMLFDPLRASASNKQRVTTVVTHELAHQWFGNLVTMKWWDDLWLNEGFASFVEYLGADNAFPDWHYMENFVVNDLFVAMAYDEHVNSHPIFVPVASPLEIGDVFDDISYSKGGSVLRMIQFFLGKQTFQRGLTKYLNNHRYGNADHNDLWTALKEQSRVDGSNIDVNAVMDTWVLQMNFPVVTIHRSGVREFNVKQDRFLMNPAASDPMKYVSKFGYKWIIPVTIATEASPNFNQHSNNIMWLNSPQSDLMLPQDIQDNNNGWFIANIQQYGFYRVNYDISNWHKIIEQLKNNHTVIHTLNRAQVINDAWSISRSGNLNLSIALSAIDYLSNENTYVVWATAFRHLQYVDHMLEKTDLYGMFMSVMADMLTPAFRGVGLESSVTDSQGDRLLRSLLSENACRYGLQSCVNNATSLFKDLPSQRIDPDIKETVYCTGIAHGTSDQWESLLQMLKATTDSAEKLRILRSLACSQVPWILNRLLTLTLDNDVVPKQEVTKVIVAVSKNPVGRNLAWEFLIANKERTQDVWKGILHFDRMVQDVSESFNTPYELQQLKDVIEAEGEEAQESRAYQQALEQTQINIHWMASNRDTLRQWLESKTGLPSRSP